MSDVAEDTSRRFARDMAWISGGLLVWGLHLAVVYAWAGVVCGRAWSGRTLLGAPIVDAGVWGATLPALATTLWLLVAARRVKRRRGTGDPRRFLDSLAGWSAGFGLVAVVWTALVVVLVAPPCIVPVP